MDREAEINPVFVEWLDPHSVDPWTNIEEIETERTKIISIGYLIRQTNDSIVLALNYDKSEQTISCVMIIPKVCIIQMKQVKVMGDLGLVDG